MALEGLVDETKFFPILQALQECLCAELEKAGGPGLCYCGLMVGDIVPIGLMDCSSGNCGVAWVRPVTTFPSLVFPNPADFAKCGAPLAMQIEVGVARCYPRAEGREARPSPQAMFDATRLYMSDMAAMKRAIVCCLKGQPDTQHALGSWNPIAVGGGTSGGTWTVTVG